MKIKHLLAIILIFTLVNTWSCSKESPSEPDETTQQIEKLEQPPATQFADRESTTQDKFVQQEKELVSKIVGAEQSESDETEYFALFMDNQKIGHAIQDRIVEGDKVTTSVKLSITISRTGIPVSISMSSVTIETTDGKPLGFEIEQDLGLLQKMHRCSTVSWCACCDISSNCIPTVQ